MRIRIFYLPFLWVLVILCFISITLGLFISLVFSDNLDSNKFNIEGIIVPEIKSTNKAINFIALKNNSITQANRTMFLQNMIKEYIVNRYTVVGSNYVMNKNLGLNKLDSSSLVYGYILKVPSSKGYNKEGQKVWTDAYLNFLNKKDGELEEIKKLMKENTTRSVRILSLPKKEGDWWITDVEFIYKTPITYSFSEAKKEKYQIKMDINIYDLLPLNITTKLPASSIFKTQIKYLQKTKL